MILNYGDYEYEISIEDIDNYLKTRTKNELLEIIFNVIDYDELFNYLEDDLLDYFEDEANEQYEDSKEYDKDPLGYFGMKQSDFI